MDKLELKELIHGKGVTTAVIKRGPARPEKKIIYLPIVDAHSHIMSTRCTPLNIQWAAMRDSTAGIIYPKGTSRETLEGVGGFFHWISKSSKFIKLGSQTTLEIAGKFIKQMNSVLKPSDYVEPGISIKKYLTDSTKFFLNVVMPMNIDFAHFWANYGLPVFLPIGNNDDGDSWYYFDEYCKSEKIDPIDMTSTINYLTYDCGLADMADEFNITVKDTAGKKVSPADINKNYMKKKYRHYIKKLYDPDYYMYADQNKDHINAAIRYPFQIFPFYHYEPRCHYKDKNQIEIMAADLENNHAFFEIENDNPQNLRIKEKKFTKEYFKGLMKRRFRSNDSVFENIARAKGGKGLFWGMKMYTRLGYAPDDFKRFPQLEDFYQKCVDKEIPITCHCSPGGMGIADQYIYFKEAVNNHKFELKKDGSKTEISDFWNKKDEEIRKRWKKNKFLWFDWNEEKDFKPIGNDLYDIKGRALPNGIRYIDEACVRPKNWEKVLQNKKFKDLKLCLAHFGGSDAWKEFGDEIEDKDEWNDFRGEIIELAKNYKNVYTDISCYTDMIKTVSYGDDVYKTYLPFAKFINDNPKLKDKILMGTDWYMTELDMTGVAPYARDMFETLQHVSNALPKLSKKLHFDAYYQFSVINPLRFLGLLDGSGNLDMAMIEEHKKFVLGKLNDTDWQKLAFEKKLDDNSIQIAKTKADEIFNLISKVKLEKSNSTERKERIKKDD